MFQDIAPHQFHNEFLKRKPRDTDYVIVTNNNRFLLECSTKSPAIPSFATIKMQFPSAVENMTFLFHIDDTAFYLSIEKIEQAEGFEFHDVEAFRGMEPSWLGFAGATASHLAHWYNTHQFCGRCTTPLKRSETERAVCCPTCGFVDYPKISPVVIVAITNGDRILLTKYAHAGYKKYALVAGFVEFGETLEGAISREVMEEVGLKVKNFRYYKSQPWAFSQSLISGFFVDLDGDAQVKVDRSELSEAVWFTRDEIPKDDSTLSITWEMIEAFRNNKFV